MNIGENIKKIRQWKGMGQKEISVSSGIPQGSISKIEGGKDFLWSKLEKISQALNCEIVDIVCFDSSKVTFNLSGDKAKGVVINQGISERQLTEINQILKDENSYLKRMLEKSINQSSKKQNTWNRKVKRKY